LAAQHAADRNLRHGRPPPGFLVLAASIAATWRHAPLSKPLSRIAGEDAVAERREATAGEGAYPPAPPSPSRPSPRSGRVPPSPAMRERGSRARRLFPPPPRRASAASRMARALA